MLPRMLIAAPDLPSICLYPTLSARRVSTIVNSSNPIITARIISVIHETQPQWNTMPQMMPTTIGAANTAPVIHGSALSSAAVNL